MSSNDNPRQKKNIAIIGAGPVGLSAAHALSAHNCQITIFEEKAQIGGNVNRMIIGEERLDCFRHQLQLNDYAVLSLISEMDIAHRVVWYPEKHSVYLDERVYPLSTIWDLLLLHPLSIADRLRILRMFIKVYQGKRTKNIEKQNAMQWAPHIGQKAYDAIIRPFLLSRFGADADYIAAEWVFDQLASFLHQNKPSKPTAGYLDGGFNVLFDALQKTIEDAGHHLYTDTKVLAIQKTNAKTLEIVTATGTQEFDQILHAASPMQLFGMNTPLSHASIRARNISPYKGLISLVLELDRPLSAHCLVTVLDDLIPFSQVSEHTNWVGLRGYGSHVVYISAYADLESNLWNESDESIQMLFMHALPQIFPMFSLSQLRKASIYRAPYAQPVVRVGYKNMTASVTTEIPGLFVANITGSLHDYSLNEAILLGKEAAAVMISNKEAI